MYFSRSTECAWNFETENDILKKDKIQKIKIIKKSQVNIFKTSPPRVAYAVLIYLTHVDTIVDEIWPKC